MLRWVALVTSASDCSSFYEDGRSSEIGRIMESHQSAGIFGTFEVLLSIYDSIHVESFDR